ncbi:c-type heme family protein [Mastigocoleus testarum]|uniref:Histidine kinase n=1 Tax=Mastigocoleus testarum BC008 TaxID=371196 RepID=A0A0V7ZNH4_9CYAN|nr:DUF3365 domain-containing protein [Mastigocoleus testarum]KST66125.1 histidine kinase [Mastigocoleus testarum BC008]
MFRKIEKIFRSLSLARKLTILLTVIFLGGIIFSGIAFTKILNYKAQEEITSNTKLLFSTLNSVRSYTSVETTPELKERLEKEEFLPQIVPSYASRRVFEKLRQDEYKDFLYKEAMLNPTNPKDKADEFEVKIIEKLRKTADLNAEISGFRNFGNERYFYIARPLAITESSCLECHSTPDVAPKAMIEMYGDKNGFGWQLNKPLGTQILSIPTTEVLQKANTSLAIVMSIVTVIFAFTICMTNYWVKRYVVRPIKHVVNVAEAVSTGNMEAEFDKKFGGKVSKDEIGNLVEAFTRMKISLVMAIRALEKYRFNTNRDKD